MFWHDTCDDFDFFVLMFDNPLWTLLLCGHFFLWSLLLVVTSSCGHFFLWSLFWLTLLADTSSDTSSDTFSSDTSSSTLLLHCFFLTQGAFCFGAITWDEVVPARGYWQDRENDRFFAKCKCIMFASCFRIFNTVVLYKVPTHCNIF